MKSRPFFAVGILLIACAGFFFWKRQSAPVPAASAQTPPGFEALLASEEVLLGLTPQLHKLADAIADLNFPSHDGSLLFADTVSVRDLDPAHKDKGELDSVKLDLGAWAIEAGSQEVPRAELELWAPIFEGVKLFEVSKFKFVRGHFVDESQDVWQTDMHYSGLARMQDGSLRALSGDVDARWKRVVKANKKAVKPGAEEEMDDWFIQQWHTEKMSHTDSGKSLFKEVLDDLILDPEQRYTARRSQHEEEVVDYIRSEDKSSPRGTDFIIPAAGYHPSVVVVDIDSDGDDDLYLTRRWGTGLLYVNDGAGQFEERGAEFGLDLDIRQSSALFADFDNDGDQDAIIGGFLERSMYLENVNGKFVDRTETHIDGGALPGLATSLSAADYDGDGLLDVYIATYHRFDPDDRKALVMGKDLISAEDYAETERQVFQEGAKRVRNRYGPPNHLLRNAGGGRFELIARDPNNPVAGHYRNTLQASWGDFDNDGDPDLYCANDYAPNYLFRNDGGGEFTDVTEETGTVDVGFGMGASWADFNDDGQMDLYVTNMFSKAGLRITSAFPDLDPAFAMMAHGNTLFQNKNLAEGELAGMEHVSGLKDPKLLVERAGWSWGGQFTDFDNDSDLDIHAISGYYTAPKQVALPVDR